MNLIISKPSIILFTIGMIFVSCKREGGDQGNNKVTQDISGYNSVKIGSQIWMAKNLDVDTFKNGDTIHEAITTENWKKALEEGKPAWCYYVNDPSNGKIYGKLYNWYAVSDPRGLAPQNWHIPIDKEWAKLVHDLGGRQEDLAQSPKSHSAYSVGIKIRSTTGWGGTSIATNESGFSGLPGGYREGDANFNGIGGEGYWWSSSESFVLGAYSEGVLWLSGNAFSYYNLGNAGCSVRCVKD